MSLNAPKNLIRLLAIAIFTISWRDSAQQKAAPARTVTLRVEVSGLRSSKGKVGCSLWASASGFANKPEKAFRRQFVAIVGTRAVCEFKSVPTGSYAASAMHDEDGDGKMRMTLFGAPLEGRGASRDARPGFMRGPRFEDASFRVTVDATVPITIRY